MYKHWKFFVEKKLALEKVKELKFLRFVSIYYTARIE